VITGRDLTALERVRASLGKHAMAFRNDVVDIAAADAIASELRARKVGLDALFVNAGIAKCASVPEASEALWNAIFDTNVKGPYFQIQSLLTVINPGAAIVLNGSINAHIGAAGFSIYAASKAALISLAKTLSAELLPRGIRVNVVSPGPIDTPLYDKFDPDPSRKSASLARLKRMIPLGRLGKPEEVAATVLHLAAAESAFIIGTEITVDGGMSQL